MKRTWLTLTLVAAFASVSMAQPRAVGARLGGDADFTYQHQVGRNMIDLTVGVGGYWDNAYTDINCMYDWVWNISGGFNWYVGVGGGLGYHFAPGYDANRLRVKLGGQLGIEYQFGIPLNLSLDWRPMANVLGYHTAGYLFDYWSVGLGVKYRF